MIRFESAAKTYEVNGSTVNALEGLDLVVRKGETLCMIGTSGSGKTTALKMVNRLVEPTSGTVLVNGIDVRKQDEIRLRRSIGYVIQRGGLFPHMTVTGNISLLCRIEQWTQLSADERAEELLELVGLTPEKFANRRPSELSGGEQQRVGFARALALDPDVVLMDEPFGALDPITRSELHAEFIALRDKVRKTILLVTHDLAEAFKLGDRVAQLDEGRLVQTGTESEFFDTPANEFVRRFVRSHTYGG